MSWSDLTFLLGSVGQQLEINDVRDQLDRVRTERDLANWDVRKVRDLAEESLELHVRLGLLVRLLIAKGVITAEEYASLIAEAQPKQRGRGA